MAHTTRTTILSILAAGIIATAIPLADGDEADAGDDLVAPTAPVILTPEYADMIQWALDRYAEAGLDLPGVSVGVYDDPVVCGDRRGFHKAGVVTVCALNPNPSTQQGWRRHTLLHELAHAWADLHLIDAQRRGFIELRGAATWRDRDKAWEDRATEHAAEIIAWAVADYPYYPHIGLTDRTCHSFTTGYRYLTGTQPPHGHTDHCEPAHMEPTIEIAASTAE